MKIDEKDKFLLNEYNILLDKSNGYFIATKESTKQYLHRLILKAKKGDIVDHINQDKTDNRRCNLRIVSKNLNNYNRTVSSKYGRGVYFDKSGNRFRACISQNNKTIKLGSFKNYNDAKIAYNKKAKEIYGEDAFQHDIKDGFIDTPHFEVNI